MKRRRRSLAAYEIISFSIAFLLRFVVSDFGDAIVKGIAICGFP